MSFEGKGLNVKVPLAKPIFDEEMQSAALDALQNEKLVMGESVFRFEEEFARYCGARFDVSTSSGLLMRYMLCALNLSFWMMTLLF